MYILSSSKGLVHLLLSYLIPIPGNIIFFHATAAGPGMGFTMRGRERLSGSLSSREIRKQYDKGQLGAYACKRTKETFVCVDSFSEHQT